MNGRYFKLDGLELDVLCHAMTHHSNGAVNADPTVQTCWDADSLGLGRVGVMPAARHRSLESATHIESAYSWNRQPRGLLGDALGFELSPPGQNKQENIHAETFNDQPNT
jgi:hypothetical protein